MLIESGANKERKIRSTLLLILVAVFTGLFAFDGWRGYAKQNLDAYVLTIPESHRPQTDKVPVYETVNESIVPRLARTTIIIADDPEGAIGAVVGGPPSIKTPDAWYYIGPAYALKFAVQNGRPTGDVTPIAAKHSATDISWQKKWTYVLSVLSAAALIHVIRVRLAKARLDDAGLTLGGGPTISWDSMKRLDSTHFRKKGWVVLYHGDPETPAKIDEYHFAKFDDIIDAICVRKGFDNPLIKASTDSASIESSDASADQAEV